jgi:uncharacterized protein
VVLLLGLACTSPAPPATTAPPGAVADVTVQGWVGPPLDRGEVVLHDAFGGSHPVQVEVADTQPARTRGMMWRTSAADGTGMLFIFPSEAEHAFWMRNTLIPLDMLFLDRSGEVVGIIAQAEPQSLDQRTVGRPSLYVLEVRGGWAEKAGVGPGTRVELKGDLAKRRGRP